MRVSIPIVSDLSRVERGWLVSALASLFTNSREEHDVVVVSNDADREQFLELLKPWPVRLVHLTGPFLFIRDGVPVGNRLYEYLNCGARHAETEWLLTPPGDDSYFFPGWECLLDAVDPKLAERAIWTPTLLETYPHHFHQVTFDRPMEMRIGWLARKMLESELLKFFKTCPRGDLRTEQPHERLIAHWANTVQHRDLYWRAGGFLEQPPLPESHDLHLHDEYSRLSVTKFCVANAVIGNCRVPIELGR